MSPEQVLGRPLDPRTDIYAFGAVLYEMLTGVVPFRADRDLIVLSMQCTSAPLPPRTVSPEADIPPAVEAIILRCLAKQPSDRFQDARALAAALTAARVPGSGAPEAASSSRRWLLAALLLGLFAVAGVAVVLGKTSSEPAAQSGPSPTSSSPDAGVNATASAASPHGATAVGSPSPDVVEAATSDTDATHDLRGDTAVIVGASPDVFEVNDVGATGLEPPSAEARPAEARPSASRTRPRVRPSPPRPSRPRAEPPKLPVTSPTKTPSRPLGDLPTLRLDAPTNHPPRSAPPALRLDAPPERPATHKPAPPTDPA